MKRAAPVPSSTQGSRPALLLRPGLAGWELWSWESGVPLLRPLPEVEGAEEAAREAMALPAAAQLPERVALAVPVRQLVYLRLEEPMGLETHDGLGLELEAAGLVASPEPKRWTARACGPIHPAREGMEPTRSVAVALLTDEALASARELDALEAVPAPALLPLPAEGLILLRELGRPVVLLVREHHVVHAQALGSLHWDLAAARELRLLAAALVAEGLLSGLPQRAIFYDAQAAQPGFAAALGLQLDHQRSLPTPSWPKGLDLPVLPHRLEQAQAKRRRRLLQRVGAAVALLVLLWLGFLAAQYGLLQFKKNRLERDLARNADLVEQLRRTDVEYYEVVDPLLRPSNQPLEMFRAIHSLKPGGVKLERLSTGPLRVEIRGNASSPRDALDLQGRLQASAVFSGWTWENQVPTVDSDGRTKFIFNANSPAAVEANSDS